MFAPPIAQQNSSLSSLHQMGLSAPAAASNFMSSSSIPFGSQDIARAHQELNERFLRDRAALTLFGSTSNAAPSSLPFGLYPELHQQQQLSQHLASQSRPLLASSQLSWLFDKLPKFDAASLGRQPQPSGLPPYPGLSPLFPPMGPIGSGLSGAFQPKNGVSVLPPSSLLPLPERDKLSNHPPISKRSGRWCAAHVRIAWQIHLHLQKQQQQQSTESEGSKLSLSPDISANPFAQPDPMNMFPGAPSLRSPFDINTPAAAAAAAAAAASFLGSGPLGSNSLQRLPPVGLNNPLLPRSPFGNIGPFGIGAFCGGLGNNLPNAMFGARETLGGVPSAQEWARFMRQSSQGGSTGAARATDSERMRERDKEDQIRRRSAELREQSERTREKEGSREKDRNREMRDSKTLSPRRNHGSPERVESSSGSRRSRSRSPLRNRSLNGEQSLIYHRSSHNNSENEEDICVDSGCRAESADDSAALVSRERDSLFDQPNLSTYWSAAMNLSRIELQRQMERQRGEVMKRIAQFSREDVMDANRLLSAAACHPLKRLSVPDAMTVGYGKTSSPRSPLSNSQSPDSSSKDKSVNSDSDLQLQKQAQQ